MSNDAARVRVRDMNPADSVWGYDVTLSTWGWIDSDQLQDLTTTTRPAVPMPVIDDDAVWWVLSKAGNCYGLQSIDVEEVPDEVDRPWVYVCEDCAMWSANGMLPDYDDNLTAERNEERLEEIRSGNAFTLDCGEDAEFCVGFSWDRCDACGTGIGGSRHRALLLEDMPYANRDTDR